jgi:hypothetical protein
VHWPGGFRVPQDECTLALGGCATPRCATRGNSQALMQGKKNPP